MAAITAAVVVGSAVAYSANRQASAAKDASKKQAEGVRNAQEETRKYREQALGFIDPAYDQAREDIQGGYQSSRDTLSPLADYALPYMQEQQDLLGLGAEGSYDQALSRVADPLQREQEQAFMRNAASLGGVGGNVLSALAEQTRSRTEANIGNRLSQLGAVAAPSLTALQQIAQQDLNQGQTLGQMSINRGQDQANIATGSGRELTQLAQNLGNANAGYDLYRANNAHWATQGITAGLSAYGGMGGMFGGAGGGGGSGGSGGGYYGGYMPPPNSMPNWVDMGGQSGQVNMGRY